MIDPVIFSFKLFTWTVELTWYGLIVMSGVMIGAWFAEREVRRRGEDGETLIDAMVWAVIGGILGARLWYVLNATLGGNRSYIEDPISIIRPPIAGLHFFGGLLFGAIILIIYLRRNGYDVWLFMDAVAPVTLIGQAFGRLGNFINQELYGPPTLLPWGIPISAEHRLPQFSDLSQSQRFHPTFAYEMILNVIAFLFIFWYSRRNDEEVKPGTVFSLWLIFAGFIRTFIEFFRPDQPRIGDSFISYTMVVAFLMGLAGVILYLARMGKVHFAFMEGWWEDEYKIKKVEKPIRSRRTTSTPAPVVEEIIETEEEEEEKEKEKAVKPTEKRRTATKEPATRTTSSSKSPKRKKKEE